KRFFLRLGLRRRFRFGDRLRGRKLFRRRPGGRRGQQPRGSRIDRGRRRRQITAGQMKVLVETGRAQDRGRSGQQPTPPSSSGASHEIASLPCRSPGRMNRLATETILRRTRGFAPDLPSGEDGQDRQERTANNGLVTSDK